MMWENKHLPGLPGAVADEENGVNVITHQFGVLEELEKAHIYIEQLHKRLKVLETEQADRIEALESEQERLVQTVELLMQKAPDSNLYTLVD
jgi:hypothetical protein